MPSYFFHLLFELYSPDSKYLESLPLTSTLINEVATSKSIKGSIFVPKSADQLWQGLPNTKPEPNPHRYSVAKAKGAISSSSGHLDARFGKCTIESIDMAPAPPSKSGQRGSEGKAGGAAASSSTRDVGTSPKIAGGPIVPKARFLPLESKTTNVGYGIIHLYRDNVETPNLHTGNEKKRERKASFDDDVDADLEDSEENEEALKTVAILAVPSYMTASDFLGFVGDRTCEAVSHFRMIRTAKANRYMVLMKFRERLEAKRFVERFNGTVFNSMEVRLFQSK